LRKDYINRLIKNARQKANKQTNENKPSASVKYKIYKLALLW